MNMYRCPRDNKLFDAEPRTLPSPEGEYTVIDCPRCGRGYVLQPNGKYECEPGRYLVVVKR